jgi:hypothetical protein
MVPVVTFREREGFADQLTQSLAQRVVPALPVRRLARPFAAGHRLRLWNHGLIRLPEVCIAGRFAPGSGHLLPEKTAALFAAVAEAAGDPWARRAVPRHPNPSGSSFERTKDQSSSHSSSGAASGAGGRKVVFRGGRAAAFLGAHWSPCGGTPQRGGSGRVSGSAPARRARGVRVVLRSSRSDAHEPWSAARSRGSGNAGDRPAWPRGAPRPRLGPEDRKREE